MTEKELTLLGFKQEKVEEYDTEESYYYVIDIVDGITFITPTNEEIKNNEWYVEFFNTNPSIRFTEFGEVQGLINQLTRAVVKLPKVQAEVKKPKKELAYLVTYK